MTAVERVVNSTHTVLMKGDVQGAQCVGYSRPAGLAWGRGPGLPQAPAAAVVCSLALRDLLTYDNTLPDVACLVCQGRRHEMSCFLPPGAGRNWR